MGEKEKAAVHSGVRELAIISADSNRDFRLRADVPRRHLRVSLSRSLAIPPRSTELQNFIIPISQVILISSFYSILHTFSGLLFW